MQLAEVATPVPNGDLDEGRLTAVGDAFGELYERLYGKGPGSPRPAEADHLPHPGRRAGVDRPKLASVARGSGRPQG